MREIIAYHLTQAAHKVFDGAIELDESYFGGARTGKRGRGAATNIWYFEAKWQSGKVAKWQSGKVYTKLVNDTKAATLMPLITRKIAPDSVVYTDCLAVITH